LKTRRAALISHGNETIRRQEHHVGAGLRAHRAGRAHASPILPPGRLAAPEATWEPPADVFEDEREIAIVVALPGVAADRVEVQHVPGTLVVRAERPLPFGSSPRAIRRLEIPHGFFERRVALPPEGSSPSRMSSATAASLSA
jgi:HSP20 family molecular chaperone IbpA